MRILLADDHALLRDAVKGLIERSDLQAEVLVAGTLPEAIRLVGGLQPPPDLILLDLDMPGLDGEQVFQRLRELDPGVRVLISSGYLDREREGTLRAAGIDGILDKPYDSLTLLRAVANFIRDGQQRRKSR